MIVGHTHFTPLTQRTTNWYGSVVLTIDLNRRFGIYIQPPDAGSKGVANAVFVFFF